jgi:hypothetical protein
MMLLSGDGKLDSGIFRAKGAKLAKGKDGFPSVSFASFARHAKIFQARHCRKLTWLEFAIRYFTIASAEFGTRPASVFPEAKSA